MPPKSEQSMLDHEIRTIVAEVLAEQRRQYNDDLGEVVAKAVAAILTSFGIEESERLEMKADFAHLRKWRRSVEQAQSYTFKIIVTTIVGGIVGAVVLGFKDMLGK